MPKKIAILGAGNGGLAAAAHLTLRGYEVRLHSRRPALIETLRAAGGIKLQGVAGEGRADIKVLSSDIADVIPGADLVMMVMPAPAVTGYAEQLTALLEPGQPVFLNPGGTGGSLALAHAMRQHGWTGDLPLCEVSTLTYACRSTAVDTVNISNLAPEIPFAAYPGKHGQSLYELVHEIYPSIRLRSNVLETGLANLNAIEHPPQILLNTGWIEHTSGDFFFYTEGTTPSVGRVIDAVDAERRKLAAAFGIATEPFPTMFYKAGYTTAEAAETGSAYESLQASEANSTFRAPATMDHRYVHEDVGFALVPWEGWAKVADVAMPTVESLITIASTVSAQDYRSTGLSRERMGLAGVGRDELFEMLESGPSGGDAR